MPDAQSGWVLEQFGKDGEDYMNRVDIEDMTVERQCAKSL